MYVCLSVLSTRLRPSVYLSVRPSASLSVCLPLIHELLRTRLLSWKIACDISLARETWILINFNIYGNSLSWQRWRCQLAICAWKDSVTAVFASLASGNQCPHTHAGTVTHCLHPEAVTVCLNMWAVIVLSIHGHCNPWSRHRHVNALVLNQK